MVSVATGAAEHRLSRAQGATPERSLDVAALQRSFDALVMRHESLRTHLQEDGDSALQVIAEQARVQIAVVDARESQLKDLVEAEIAQPFDLQQGPLLRVKLLRLAPEEHVLVLVQHHIVSDGWSMQVMVDELVQLYAAHVQGQDLQLPALPIQYADYALWQRSWMEAGSASANWVTGPACSGVSNRYWKCRWTDRDRRCRATGVRGST